jgi:hypothetical protein
VYIYDNISLIIHRTRNISGKFIQKVKHTFYFEEIAFENHGVYEIMCKNVVKPERSS